MKYMSGYFLHRGRNLKKLRKKIIAPSIYHYTYSIRLCLWIYWHSSKRTSKRTPLYTPVFWKASLAAPSPLCTTAPLPDSLPCSPELQHYKSNFGSPNIQMDNSWRSEKKEATAPHPTKHNHTQKNPQTMHFKKPRYLIFNHNQVPVHGLV